KLAPTTIRASTSTRSGGAGVPWVARAIQAEVVAVGLAFVLLAEDTPALQLRHHQAGEVLEALGQVRRHHVEAVGTALDEPLLDQVGNGLHRTHCLQVPTGYAEAQHQLADGQV